MSKPKLTELSRSQQAIITNLQANKEIYYDPQSQDVQELVKKGLLRIVAGEVILK